MERIVKTKFYHFNQNNSGGYFVQDEAHGIGEDVIIEALSPKDALDRLQKIGDNVSGFNNYCGCCGERWSDYLDESDGTEEPMIYSEPIAQCKKGMFREKCYVHYFDGTFKRFDLK